MKAVLINIYIRINGKRVLLIILYKTLQCIIFFYDFLGLFLTSHLLLPLAFQSRTPVRTTGILESKVKENKSAQVSCCAGTVPQVGPSVRAAWPPSCRTPSPRNWNSLGGKGRTART